MREPSAVARTAVIAGALIALLALYWSTVSYHYGGDGLLFAGSVEGVRAGNTSATTLLVFFHAHHVLYGPFGLLVHAPWDAATPAATTMAMGNGALAVVTCLVFFLLCRRLGAGKPGAALATVTLAVSFAFWLFAVHAETYMLAQFGAVTFFWLLTRKTTPIVVLSLVWALAVGGHIANVLLLIPLVVWELAQRKPRRLAGTVAGGGLATLAVYLAAMRWTGAPWTLTGMVEWIRPRGDYVEMSAGGAGETLSAIALGVGPGMVWVGLAAVGLLAVALRKRSAERAGLTWALLGAWFVTFLVFFSIWDAGNVEFTLWLTTPLFLALAMLERGLKPGWSVPAVRIAWALAVVAMAATTYLKEIGPHRDPGTNAYLRITQELGERMAETDTLLISGAGPSARYKFYLPYFTGRTSYGLIDRYRSLGEPGLRAELAALGDSVRRGERRIFGLPELFEAEGLGEMQEAGFSASLIEELRAGFRLAGTLELDDGESIDLFAWSPVENRNAL